MFLKNLSRLSNEKVQILCKKILPVGGKMKSKAIRFKKTGNVINISDLRNIKSVNPIHIIAHVDLVI